jgi:Putative MetA-pathway of phenol degradation
VIAAVRRPPRQTWRRSSLLLSVVAGLLLAATATAQDMEPRAYSNSPTGANFLVLGYGRSTGEVLFDATLPLADVKAELNAGILGLGRTFGIGGRLALLTAALPYSWGNVEGRVFEETRQVTRSGLVDPRVKLSVNLFGPPAMSPREFVRAPRRTVVGASLTAIVPVGQYDPTKLINLGTNRWAFKPEVGVSHPAGRWDLDAYAGLWLFGKNDAFFPGPATRRQDPVVAIQGHASYTFRPRTWAAFDATWYGGGEATVDDGPPTSRLSNTRFGATLAWPFGRQHSVKVAYSTGAWTRVGSDFRTFAVAWQFLWMD